VNLSSIQELGVIPHNMLWPDRDDYGTTVDTAEDWPTYTHLLYLDTPAEIVVQRCKYDSERGRPSASVGHVRRSSSAGRGLLLIDGERTIAVEDTGRSASSVQSRLGHCCRTREVQEESNHSGGVDSIQSSSPPGAGTTDCSLKAEHGRSSCDISHRPTCHILSGPKDGCH
jgi:hypothetical protein